MFSSGQPFAVSVSGDTIAVAGEFDLHCAPSVMAAAEGMTRCALDLAEVTFIDSSGVRSLLAIEQQVTAAGHRLRLVAPSGRVTAVLSMLGLLERFDIAADRPG